MMSEAVFESIVKLLSDENISHKLIEHKPVYTSEQAVKVRGTSIKSGAKALVFMADKSPIMIVVPGNKKVDTKKFKKQFKISNLAMATSDEVESVTGGVKIGAVHPLENLHGMPVYVDQSLGKNRQIVFNAGLHDKSIKMSYSGYYRLVKPKLGNFAV